MIRMPVYGASFNPPANHHLLITAKLIEVFGKVIIPPCGIRPDKDSTKEATPQQRKEMTQLAFDGIPNVILDFYDIDNGTFTPTWLLDERYGNKYPDSELWFVIGGDIIKGGRDNNSEIQSVWDRGRKIWNELNWAIIDHPDYPIDTKDLPPKNMVIKMNRFKGRSTIIRNRIAAGQSISDLVPSDVEKYIKDNNLYK